MSQLRLWEDPNEQRCPTTTRTSSEYTASSACFELSQPHCMIPPMTHPTELVPGSTPTVRTDLGALYIADCLDVLRQMPDQSVDLIVTSPPYNDQPKYRDDERYAREWYEDTFLKVSDEVLRVVKPTGSFILNYRSKRTNGERGTLQYEIVFWLREQGWNF